jgi:hypothetical protein
LDPEIVESSRRGTRDPALRDPRVESSEDSAERRRRKPKADARDGPYDCRRHSQAECGHHLLRGMSGKRRLETLQGRKSPKHPSNV